MDAPNQRVILAKAQKLIRYLYQTEYGFDTHNQELGGGHFIWSPTNPNVLSFKAYTRTPDGSVVVEEAKEVNFTPKLLLTLYKNLSQDAYKKAEKEYLEEQVINYLNNKLKEIE